MAATSNTFECFRDVIGLKVVGVLKDAMPPSRRDLAAGTKTLVFEDGTGLTFAPNGSVLERPVIAQALPPSADVQLPPYARRLDVRATRAAFAAGTLGTVGDDSFREDVKGDVEVRHADGYDANVMPTDHEPREWYDEAEQLRQSRLRRWQTIR
jgi:hypothetical protein